MAHTVTVSSSHKSELVSSQKRSKKQERLQLYQRATGIFYRSLNKDQLEIQCLFTQKDTEAVKSLSQPLDTHKSIHSFTYSISSSSVPVLTLLCHSKLQPQIEKWLTEHPSQK